VFITGANVHEVTRVESTLRAKVAWQQADGGQTDENLCADAGFVGSAPIMQAYGYMPHIRPRNAEADLIKHQPDFKARRWVAEAFFSWLKRHRKVHVRYEKTLLSYWGLVTLACALICLKKASAI
jgi:transposase